jgi:acetyl-CoA C-acetyltransferase
MSGSVVVAGARTPIGKLAGVLGTLSAMELGGIAIASALERAGVSPDRVDSIVMGQVVQAGQGQDPARQAAVHAGIPLATPATTINKSCLSGLQALYLADLMIGAGDAEIVVAGGMESMTQIPYILPGARGGFRLDSTTLYDGMMLDGLSCAFDQCSMGTATERFNRSAGISREQQDAFAAGSHEKAAAAAKDGRLAEEIVAVSVPQRRGDPVMIDADEGIRPGTTTESLATLRPRSIPRGPSPRERRRRSPTGRRRSS